MNTLEQLKQTWTAGENYQPEVQQRIWDRVARDYGDLPLPDFETNDFLRLMVQETSLTADMRTLDIGCGSGVYSMALASRVGEACGVDISPKMIDYAKERSQTLALRNTRFSCVDWSQADIDALGLRGAFDVVFAHMTPAICDYETFDKLNACSRNLCMMEKPTRRRDQIQDAAFRLIGLDRSDEQYHGSVLPAFTYLWYKGYCPQFYYHDDVWRGRKTVEDMTAWCADRARLHKELTTEKEAAIRSFMESQAEDGYVQEVTTTTRVTIIWRVS